MFCMLSMTNLGESSQGIGIWDTARQIADFFEENKIYASVYILAVC